MAETDRLAGVEKFEPLMRWVNGKLEEPFYWGPMLVYEKGDDLYPRMTPAALAIGAALAGRHGIRQVRMLGDTPAFSLRVDGELTPSQMTESVARFSTVILTALRWEDAEWELGFASLLCMHEPAPDDPPVPPMYDTFDLLDLINESSAAQNN